MSVPKWNSNEIIKFLDVYERYEILWNVRCDEYANKSKRETAFKNLLQEIKDRGFQKISFEILRKMIKYIKTVYRKELAKIVKYKKVLLEQRIYKG
jgi:TRAP-type mannitol/chloroaromatic compound transport system substrate-binding protein